MSDPRGASPAPTAPRAASLVVPNYNGRALLERNVPSLLAAADAYPGDAEVVIVDDASQDDSVAFLRGAFPTVRVVEHAENQGFGGACHSGVDAAAHPVAVLLNSDVTVERDFLAPLTAHFTRDPDVFSVSPLVLDRDGRPGKITVNRPSVRRGELRWDGVDPDDLLRLRALGPDVELEIKSLFGLGGAVAVDRARFLGLGGFDPLYKPFYHEDVDLGLMAWRRGWRVLVEPRSAVTHADGGTINKHYQRYEIKVARRAHRILCGWKHAEGSWRSAMRWSTWLRVLTRWLKLDRRYYAALRRAWSRRAEAAAAHQRELAATVRPLDDAFAEIQAAWPPQALP